VAQEMTERTAGRRKPAYYLTSDGRVVSRKPRSRTVTVLLIVMALLCLGVLAAGAGAAVALTTMERAPREWAVYLRQLHFGGSATATAAAHRLATWLARADNLGPADGVVIPAFAGASPRRSGVVPQGPVRLVHGIDGLRDAVGSALPGDVILLAPGTYRVAGGAVHLTTIGNPNGPITIRAATLGEVAIESDVFEAFSVTGAFWHIENLVMRGVCADHAMCEHAIHVVGTATDTVIRNNRLEDFNAHLKINGDRGEWPDRGVIEGNTLIDTGPRNTRNTIADIDLVGASEWRIGGNVIADFARTTPGDATYGGYVKGAGQKNVFERNIVLCAWKLCEPAGPRVGVSLGGGGTDGALRRDGGATGMEQVGGIVRDNLIAFCSDAGIYLNRAARSTISHNTLLDTAGIDGRSIETSGDVVANIIDGVTRDREGAALQRWQNEEPLLLGLFAGLHPQRALFRDPAALDLRWTAAPAFLPPDPDDTGKDLCGKARGPMTRAGAFDDFAACLAQDAAAKP
jgi:Chondroitinase B